MSDLRLLEAASNLLTMRWDNQDRQEVWQELSCAVAASRAQGEDDAKPVDDEWFMQLGAYEECGELLLDRPGGNLLKVAALSWCPKHQMLSVFGCSVQGKTRGDVRRLLAALGMK